MRTGERDKNMKKHIKKTYERGGSKGCERDRRNTRWAKEEQEKG